MAAEDADHYETQPNLIVSRWREKTTQYQYQRGWAYQNWISTWANLDFIVGANWYKWSNGYGNTEDSDPRNSGIVDDENHYYTGLTDSMRSVNQQLQNIRRGFFVIDNADWSNHDIDICN